MNKFKLLQKRILLVAVLLLLEFVLLAALQLVRMQSEAETARLEKSQRVLAVTAKVNKELWQDSINMATFVMVHQNEDWTQQQFFRPDTFSQLEALAQLTAEFPENRVDAQRLKEQLLLAQKFEPTVNELYRSGDALDGLRIYEFVQKQWRPWFAITVAEFSEISTYHNNYCADQKRQLNQSQSLLNQLLLLGVIMQLVLAVVLVVFFNKSITQRLQILQDNSFRLARGIPLHPHISGGDEIAELDSVFHAMASALTEAATKERAIVNGMPVGFITLSPDGTVESVNPRTQDMLKATAEELVGKPLAQIVVAENGGDDSFASISKAALSRVGEFEIRRADGTIFPAELSINAIRNLNHEQLICNLLDVTERHEAARMKKEFVAMVSHDLKTPLRSIQDSLQQLSGGVFAALNEQGEEMLKTIQEETERLFRLVTHLLDVARMESGHIDLEKIENELDSLIERSVNAVLGLANEKQIKIEFSQSQLTVRADADRLVQVLVNFLANAVKFSPLEATIRITTDEIGNDVEVSVSDQGPGVPDSAQKRIFERFEQVSSSDRIDKGGTGLGLAICKLIVEAHGGAIGIKSQVGQGSRFWFRIPFLQPPGSAGFQPASRAGSSEQ